MKRCLGLTPQLTQRVCMWFAVKLGWDFRQTKAALVQCFPRNLLSNSWIYFWMEQFRSGRHRIVDLHCQPKRKSGRSQRNIRAVESLVAQDRCITIPRIMVDTGLKATTIHRILTKDLSLAKRCAKYVPHDIGPPQIARRAAICDFWTRLRIREPRVFRVAVTMDKSWIYCYDPLTKQQSREWLRSMEPRPQKPQKTLGTRKVMVVMFFDSQGLVYREFVRRPRTVNQLLFRQILTRFDIAFQNRRPRGTAQGRRFLHMDNASPHTTFLTRQHLQNLGWTVLPHPPYLPDLAPNDFWLYPRIKRGLKGRKFATLQELEDAFDNEVGMICVNEFRRCIGQKWPERWRRCLAVQGNYFEGIH